MTDERMGDHLWTALARLPRGAGVVFRHHATPLAERRALFARLGAVARRRGLTVVRAGPMRLGRGEHGVHNQRVGHGLRTHAAHSRREAVAAVRHGTDLLFVSPVFATRSHPGATALGSLRAARIVAGLPVVTIALGGMDAGRYRRLQRLGFDGWAAIDAWSGSARVGPQKRNAVPT